MKPRWWRVAVLLEAEDGPSTWTFHVRAFTEERARMLVAERLGRPHAVYACVASEPLGGVAPCEEVVADYGPWRRDWADPALAPLRALRAGPPTREAGRAGRRPGRRSSRPPTR